MINTETDKPIQVEQPGIDINPIDNHDDKIRNTIKQVMTSEKESIDEQDSGNVDIAAWIESHSQTLTDKEIAVKEKRYARWLESQKASLEVDNERDSLLKKETLEMKHKYDELRKMTIDDIKKRKDKFKSELEKLSDDEIKEKDREAEKALLAINLGMSIRFFIKNDIRSAWENGQPVEQMFDSLSEVSEITNGYSCVFLKNIEDMPDEVTLSLINIGVLLFDCEYCGTPFHSMDEVYQFLNNGYGITPYGPPQSVLDAMLDIDSASIAVRKSDCWLRLEKYFVGAECFE